MDLVTIIGILKDGGWGVAGIFLCVATILYKQKEAAAKECKLEMKELNDRIAGLLLRTVECITLNTENARELRETVKPLLEEPHAPRRR